MVGTSQDLHWNENPSDILIIMAITSTIALEIQYLEPTWTIGQPALMTD